MGYQSGIQWKGGYGGGSTSLYLYLGCSLDGPWARGSWARVHGVPWARGMGAVCTGLRGDLDLGGEKKICGENVGERLKQHKRGVDPLEKHHIYGSKPTNSHKNHKSQEIWYGYFWWGFSKLGRTK